VAVAIAALVGVTALLAAFQLRGGPALPSGVHATEIASGSVAGYAYEVWAWAKPSGDVCTAYDAHRTLRILGSTNGGGCTRTASLSGEAIFLASSATRGLTLISGVAGSLVAEVDVIIQHDLIRIPTHAVGQVKVFSRLVTGSPARQASVEGLDSTGKVLTYRDCVLDQCFINPVPR
jgi:hypothetical protein